MSIICHLSATLVSWCVGTRKNGSFRRFEFRLETAEMGSQADTRSVAAACPVWAQSCHSSNNPERPKRVLSCRWQNPCLIVLALSELKPKGRPSSAVPADGSRETPTCCRSTTGICIKFALTSTQRRASVWASERRRKCSARRSWRQGDERDSLPLLQSRASGGTHTRCSHQPGLSRRWMKAQWQITTV